LVSFGCACQDFDSLRLELTDGHGLIVLGFRLFSRKMLARPLPEWRNGRRTGLKNPALAIAGHRFSSLAARLEPLILLVFYHFYADYPCIPKGRGFLMKLAQNLAQIAKLLCD
jgi:hypothetical protein